MVIQEEINSHADTVAAQPSPTNCVNAERLSIGLKGKEQEPKRLYPSPRFYCYYRTKIEIICKTKTIENPMKSILDQDQHKRRQYVISQLQQLHDWMIQNDALAIAECTEEEIGQALEMLKDAFPEQP